MWHKSVFLVDYLIGCQQEAHLDLLVRNFALNIHKHFGVVYLVLSVNTCLSTSAQGKFYGATYEQQEAALEILQDFCRQPSFMADMYANADCDITCSNTFGKSTF